MKRLLLALALLLAIALPARGDDAAREAALRRAEAVAAAAGVRCVRAEDPRRLVAIYDGPTRTIRLNPRDPYWGDDEAAGRENYKSGWWSTGVPGHLMTHEVGHARHHAALGAAWMPLTVGALDAAEAGRIRVAVSGYAATNKVEFVAEVYAGLEAGRTFPADVMALYRRFGGPAVPPPPR